MNKYFIVDISGRQYLAEPGKTLTVDHLGDVKTLECDVLMSSGDGKVEVGTPFLKNKAVFDVLEVVREKKVRVATYKAKARTRKVRGSRRIVSKISLKA